MSFPSTKRAPFSAESGLADRAAQVAREGPRKENGRGKKRKLKISGSSILCHKGWAGGAQAQPRRHPLYLEGPARGRLEFGRWLRFGEAGEGWQQGGRLEELFDLLGPFHVICPRLLTRQALDEVL